MASEQVLELTDDNFEEEILNADVPALVDFWAEWCMPCKMLAPTIDELAADNAGKLKVGKVDTDAARNVALKFDVQAIPTIVLIKDGQVAKKFVGLQQKADLQAAIDEVVG
jgi:thioredoxin 1